MKKTTKTTILAFAVLFGTVSTLQADVITDWQFSVNSVFTQWLGPLGNSSGEVVWQDAAAHTNAGSGVDGINFNDDNSLMSWSSQDSKGYRTSSLELNSHSGTITTDGAMETAMTMIHNNQTIGNSNPTPKVMEIAMDVLLTGLHEDGSLVVQNLQLSMLLGFIETPNKGFGLLDGHTQDDIFFVIQNPSTTKRFTDNFDNIYDVSLDAVFEELTGTYRETALHYIGTRIGDYTDVGSTDILYGWSTLENTHEANAMDVNIVVRHETMPTTPEPATMLIFAVAGALGLPACRRWRKNAKR